MPDTFNLPFTPVLAIANQHVEDCGKPPCLIDSDERKGRWAYFENEHGEQLIATQDAATGQIVVYHGDCGWENPLTYDPLGQDGPASIRESERLFLAAFALACGVSPAEWSA